MATINKNEQDTNTLSDFTEAIKLWLAENFIAKYTLDDNIITMDFLNGKKYKLTITENQ